MTINDLDARLQRMEAMVSESDTRLKRMEVMASESDARLKRMETMVNHMQGTKSTVQENNAFVDAKKEQTIISSKTDSYQASEKIMIAGAAFYFELSRTISITEKTDFLSIILSFEPIWTLFPTMWTILSACLDLDQINILFRVIFALSRRMTHADNGFPQTNARFPLDLEFLNCLLVNSDCTLLVEKPQICNQQRASYEVKLEGVVAAEFAILLKAIYQPIINENDLFAGKTCECLLRLADYFQVRLVTKRCSNYLKSCPTAKMSVSEKLQLAQDYNLTDVMEFCVGQCKTMDDLVQLFQSSHYSLLNSATKLRVYENVTKAISPIGIAPVTPRIFGRF
uniref:BTB domain-containing protein n=2 Tax=Ditylenchus dipsaci TaxID=166011 RepID=A0A915DUL0_9BILA